MVKQSVKNTIGVTLVLTVAVITAFLLFKNLSKKSDYPDSGYIKSKDVSDTVNIYTDSYGIRHISAKNDSDMYFALGYSHAKDRLWQMDFTRRVAEGRLSEILGPNALEYDKLFRTIGFSRISEKLYKELPEKTKRILESYTAGVNAFIFQYSKSMPLEFDVLDYKPDAWEPDNCIELIRLMGWEMNIGWYTDVTFGKIVSKFGIEKAKEFFPNYPEDAPFIIRSDKKKDEKPSDTSASNDNAYIIENAYRNLANLSNIFYQSTLNFRKDFGIIGTGIGSNAWVVDGSKSENGKPILANDPHVPLQTPSRWYEVHLLNEENNTNVSGFGIPGIPGILIGTNGTISWGVTNLMNDETDFYISKLDTGSHRYFFDDNSTILDSVVENIKIKGIKDEIDYTVFETKFGPVISNLDNAVINKHQKLDAGKGNILSLKWTGTDFSDEIGALAGVIKSKNWSDFTSSLRTYGLPALNFVYADVNNNIGFHAAGKVPIRKSIGEGEPDYNIVAMYPSNGNIKWTGYLSFDELPSSYNPKDKYIVTANNKPESGYKHYISNLYEAPYRAARIEELLKTRNNYSAKEFGLYQNDVMSLQAKEFCAHLFEAYKDSVSVSSNEKQFIDILKKWDYEFKAASIAASVFAMFEIELYKNLYKQKLGDELFLSYLFLNNIPVRNTAKLLKENIPGKNEILRKSLREAIESLKVKFGNSDAAKWLWGDIHKVSMNHSLGSVQALGQILNVGDYEAPGNGTTVNNIQYSFINAADKSEFESFLGPSLRVIFEMSNTNTYHSVLPPGQNGQSTSNNYRNQARLWLNGDYKTVSHSFSDLLKEKPPVFRIIPY